MGINKIWIKQKLPHKMEDKFELHQVISKRFQQLSTNVNNKLDQIIIIIIIFIYTNIILLISTDDSHIDIYV